VTRPKGRPSAWRCSDENRSLPDDLVLSLPARSRYPNAIRIAVVSANGDLLEADQYGLGTPHGLPPEKADAYVQGGSWFFCDADAWLSGLVHGLKPDLVDSCSSAASGRSLPLRRRSANRFTPARDGRMETSLRSQCGLSMVKQHDSAAPRPQRTRPGCRRSRALPTQKRG